MLVMGLSLRNISPLTVSIVFSRTHPLPTFFVFVSSHGFVVGNKKERQRCMRLYANNMTCLKDGWLHG